MIFNQYSAIDKRNVNALKKNENYFKDKKCVAEEIYIVHVFSIDNQIMMRKEFNIF
jgi:hypothetical protein